MTSSSFKHPSNRGANVLDARPDLFVAADSHHVLTHTIRNLKNPGGVEWESMSGEVLCMVACPPCSESRSEVIGHRGSIADR